MPLQAGYVEPLGLQPAVRRLPHTSEPGDVDALVRLLERLSDLAQALDHNVLPLLGQLDQLSLDLSKLIDDVGLLHYMIHRLPTPW